MISFLNIGDIKIALTENESQRLNDINSEINAYGSSKITNLITQIAGRAVGYGTAGTGLGLVVKYGTKTNAFRDYVEDISAKNLVNRADLYTNERQNIANQTIADISQATNKASRNAIRAIGRESINGLNERQQSEIYDAFTRVEKIQKIANRAPLIGGLSGSVIGALHGAYEGLNGETATYINKRILDAETEGLEIITNAINRVRDSSSNPELFDKALKENGISQLTVDSLTNLLAGNSVGNFTIETTSLPSLESAVDVQNNSLESSGCIVNMTVVDVKAQETITQPNLDNQSEENNTVNNQPSTDPETQSKWEAWLDEHPNIKTYINNVKGMDPFTISATVAGTLLIGWGLYKAAKAWKEYKAKRNKIN